MFRSNHMEMFYVKLFWKIWENLAENTCDGAFFTKYARQQQPKTLLKMTIL